MLLVTVGDPLLILFSPVRAIEVSGDIISSAFYVANWHFAAQSVDYFAQELEPSPVLHLWSLAIEEQFYLVWPTLMLAVTWFWRRRGKSVRPALWVDPRRHPRRLLPARHPAHRRQPGLRLLLDLRPRLGAGARRRLALLGTVHPRAAAPPRSAGPGWRRSSTPSFAFDATTPFPGAAALVPTLGAAALILAGSSIYVAGPGSAGRPALAPARSATSAGSPTPGTSGTGRFWSSPRRSGARSRSPPASPSSPSPGSRPRSPTT